LKSELVLSWPGDTWLGEKQNTVWKGRRWVGNTGRGEGWGGNADRGQDETGIRGWRLGAFLGEKKRLFWGGGGRKPGTEGF